MNILLIFGLLAFLWGIYALSRPTKNLPASLKYSPVFLASIGAFIVWSHFANTWPVVSTAKIEILESKSQSLALNIQIQKDRPCSLLSMDAYVVDKEGNTEQAYLQFLDDTFLESGYSTGKTELGKTIVMSYNDGPYESFYFVTQHICSYGIIVQSTFGETQLPASFNTIK